MAKMDVYVAQVYSKLDCAIQCYERSIIYVPGRKTQYVQAKTMKSELSAIIPQVAEDDETISKNTYNFVDALARRCFHLYYSGDKSRTCLIESLTTDLCKQFEGDAAFFRCALSHILAHYDDFSNPGKDNMSLWKATKTALCRHGEKGRKRADEFRNHLADGDDALVNYCAKVCSETDVLVSSLVRRVREVGKIVFPDKQWQEVVFENPDGENFFHPV